MTVYVDDFRVRARVGKITARWSHLTAGPDDDLAELHALAARIGLRRAWFQDKPWPHAHYDVTDSKRLQAIAAGAVPITWREAAEQRVRARQARQASPATPADWLLAEYQATDVDEDIRLEARVAVQPMIMLKSPYSGNPMTVRPSDYGDPDRWWL